MKKQGTPIACARLCAAQKKKPWGKPGLEGRKGVIAFSRTRSTSFFGLIEE
jgi:hypothetical protein